MGQVTAIGKSSRRDDALAGCLGEAIERYCALQPSHPSMIEAPYSQLNSSALHPRDLILYSAEQRTEGCIRHPEFTETAALSWYPARNLTTGEEILVPSLSVFLSVGEGTQPFLPPTSNGLAAGPTFEFAALNELLEVMERDSLMAAWMTKTPGVMIDDTCELLPCVVTAVKQHYKSRGIQLVIVQLRSELPALTFMAATIDRSGRGPCVTIGTGCSLDPSEAISKAVLEVCQARYGEIRRFHAQQGATRDLTPKNVRTPLDHSALFWSQARLADFSWIYEGSPIKKLADYVVLQKGTIAEQLAFCSSELSARGYATLCADITTPEIAEIGYRVVRTLVPGLQPIHFGYLQERLKGSRILLNGEVGGEAFKTLNRFPHPLS